MTRQKYGGSRRYYTFSMLQQQTRLQFGQTTIPGVVAFGGSMRYVELVDFHRKGIAMTKQSGDDLSLDKLGSWGGYL
jgi:hypothetical protein